MERVVGVVRWAVIVRFGFWVRLALVGVKVEPVRRKMEQMRVDRDRNIMVQSREIASQDIAPKLYRYST